MVAAARGPGSLPLDVVLDPAACLIGVTNNLATLASLLAAAQGPGWVERWALATVRAVEAGD